MLVIVPLLPPPSSTSPSSSSDPPSLAEYSDPVTLFFSQSAEGSLSTSHLPLSPLLFSSFTLYLSVPHILPFVFPSILLFFLATLSFSLLPSFPPSLHPPILSSPPLLPFPLPARPNLFLCLCSHLNSSKMFYALTCCSLAPSPGLSSRS